MLPSGRYPIVDATHASNDIACQELLSILPLSSQSVGTDQNRLPHQTSRARPPFGVQSPRCALLPLTCFHFISDTLSFFFFYFLFSFCDEMICHPPPTALFSPNLCRVAAFCWCCGMRFIAIIAMIAFFLLACLLALSSISLPLSVRAYDTPQSSMYERATSPLLQVVEQEQHDIVAPDSIQQSTQYNRRY